MNASIPALDKIRRPARAGRLQPRQPLAIEGLAPGLAALAAGRVHAVYADPSPARDALFWKTAAGALRGGPATVLSMRAEDEIAEALRRHGLDIDVPGSAHAKANVCVLRALPERDGMGVLLEALQSLAQQCASPGSQFLVETTDDLFAWPNPVDLARQGEQLAAWAEQSGYGVLLVTALPATQDGGAGPAIGEFHAQFAGAAQLLQAEGQYNWDVIFWQDRHTTLSGNAFRLRFSPVDDSLMAAGDAFGHGGGGLLAPDEARVIVSRDAVVRERVLPTNWEVLDDNAVVAAAASGAVAATVLFSYVDSRQFETLAEQIYDLRRQAGQALKIAVREDKISMRYETVMHNLGANLIIPRGTTISRVEEMLDGIQGQVFSRPMPHDYKGALANVMHSTEIGYVRAPHFVEQARQAVERGKIINLPSVLLRLPLLPEVAHVDALQACHMSREGDLCTACGDSVYTFFFAARLSDAAAIFKRVFKVPAGELFRGELRCGDYGTIMAMLDALEQEIADEPPLDYSDWLEQHQKTPAAGADAGASQTEAEAEIEAPPVASLAALEGVNAPRAAPQPVALPFKTQG